MQTVLSRKSINVVLSNLPHLLSRDSIVYQKSQYLHCDPCKCLALLQNDHANRRPNWMLKIAVCYRSTSRPHPYWLGLNNKHTQEHPSSQRDIVILYIWRPIRRGIDRLWVPPLNQAKQHLVLGLAGIDKFLSVTVWISIRSRTGGSEEV